MKLIPITLLVTLMASHWGAMASVVIGGTRLIYDGNKKESSLNLNNSEKDPYLIQSWVESADSKTDKAPFIATPPLFRLDGGQENILRVVRAGGNLPADRESLFWMNIKSIPSMTEDRQQDTLQIAVKTRIKLIYRPAGLKGVPEQQTDKLVWTRLGDTLQVTNPTPFYMNFQQIKVGGLDVKNVSYVAPMGSMNFKLPSGAKDSSVSWKIISDYGGIGKEHTRPL